jgi:hypothetical protein
MAPRTVGGLAGGMAHGGHIHLENYEFTGVRGPVPPSTFSHNPDLRYRDLDPAIYGERTLRTALSGSILEYTYIGGMYPHSSPTMARPFVQEARRPWLMTNSPREWPQLATSFQETTRLSAQMGQRPSPATAPSRPTTREAWVRW